MFSKDLEPYIVIAQQEWALNLGSNARNLAVEFSKTRLVIYVNPATDIKTSLFAIKKAAGRKKLKTAFGLLPNTVQVADNLWVHTPASINISINWLKNVALYNFLNKYNAKRFFKSLSKAIEELCWQANKCIVFNDSQMFTGLYTKEYLKPLLNFYYIRDNLVEHPYFKFHGSRIEPQTIQHADSVFANSSYLADYARKHNNLSINIGQGCELDIYNTHKNYAIPIEINNIPCPRIGYIGFLTGERLDIALLEELAMKKPEWQFVFIGPEEIMFQQSTLHAMKNVHFLGAKKPAELPAYIQHLNVCLNPQLINALTVGNYPRKIDEYLAMGKPTVATETPAMQMFLPHVYLAKGVNGYIKAIEEAMQEQSPLQITEAICFAKGHTWQACADKIYNIQKKLLHA